MAVSIFLATLPSPPPSFMYIQSADASEKTNFWKLPNLRLTSLLLLLLWFRQPRGHSRKRKGGKGVSKKERGTVSQAREDRRQAGLSNLPRFIILFYYAGKSAAASGELF